MMRIYRRSPAVATRGVRPRPTSSCWLHSPGRLKPHQMWGITYRNRVGSVFLAVELPTRSTRTNPDMDAGVVLAANGSRNNNRSCRAFRGGLTDEHRSSVSTPGGQARTVRRC